MLTPPIPMAVLRSAQQRGLRAGTGAGRKVPARRHDLEVRRQRRERFKQLTKGKTWPTESH